MRGKNKILITHNFSDLSKYDGKLKDGKNHGNGMFTFPWTKNLWVTNMLVNK